MRKWQWDRPRAFWSQFIKTQMRPARPVALRLGPDALLATADEVIESLRRYAEKPGLFGSAVTQLRVDGQPSALSRDWLPAASERSLDDYLARLADLAAGRDYLIDSRFCHVFFGWDVLDRVRLFLSGLYRLAGLPSNCASVELFLGRYRAHPYGAHQDAADVFIFPVKGTKKMRVWGSGGRAAGPCPGANPLAPDKTGSVVLEGRPGDLLYVPPGAWHSGESESLDTVSLTVALYHYRLPIEQELAALQSEHLRQLAAASQGVSPGSGGWIRSSPRGLADQLRSTRAYMRRNPPDELVERVVTQGFLNRVTGCGFQCFPPAETPPASDARPVRLRTPSIPILAKRRGELMIVSACGRHIDLPYSNRIAALIRALNAGRAVDVAATARGGDDFDGRALERLIATLHRYGALHSNPPTSS